MPLQLDIPLEKEYQLEETDNRFGIKDGATTVIIRQATQSAHERRANLFSNIVRELSSSDEDADIVRLIQRFSFEELKRIEVFLTLKGCNILNDKGKPLFRFNARGLISERDFNEPEFKCPRGAGHDLHVQVDILSDDQENDHPENNRFAPRSARGKQYNQRKEPVDQDFSEKQGFPAGFPAFYEINRFFGNIAVPDQHEL